MRRRGDACVAPTQSGDKMNKFPDITLPSGKNLTFNRPLIMGVLNVTPDSFSDGGHFLERRAAIDHGARMARQGADIIDVGGESTRPGADEVSIEQELERVVPVIEALVRGGVEAPISIDTTKAAVAEAALDAGAEIVNDVSALRFDSELGPLVARREAALVLMHMLGTPRTMQAGAIEYGDVVQEILVFLEARVDAAVAAGVQRGRILLDPGIGFGKTVAHNLEIVRRIGEFNRAGLPVVLGTSRKSFIGKVLDLPEDQRMEGTMATVALGVFLGAAVLRVHDVEVAVRTARMAAAVVTGH